jgi:hypothetical protein
MAVICSVDGAGRPTMPGTEAATTPRTVMVASTPAVRVRGRAPSQAHPDSSAATPSGRAVSTTPPTSARPCATASTTRAGPPASSKTALAASTCRRATTAPTKPSPAAAAPAGTASRFAGTDASPTSPKVLSSSGTTATCAPRVMASRSATRRGNQRIPVRRSRTCGATTSTPAVATADSSSPSDPASSGSIRTSSSTAPDNACRASRGTPRAKVSTTSSAIVPARSTLGSNRVR